MKKIVWLVFLVCSLSVQAQVNIVPKPVEIRLGKGFFTLTGRTEIAYDHKAENAARFLADYLKTYYNINCRLTAGIHGKQAILLMSGGKQEKKGFYDLKIDNLAI